MTFISREEYTEFCQRCGVLGFYYQENFAEPLPIAEVAGWIV